MKKLSLFICFLFCAAHISAARIVRGPYIEDPTQTTMILKWQTDVPSPGWVEYGPAPRCNQIMTVTPEATQHKAVLYGLVPNQDFCYRVYVYNDARDGAQSPAEGTFRTLYSAERKTVNFLALGATGAGIPVGENGETLPDEAAAAREKLAGLMQREVL